jgi:hypothetical protein
LSLHYLAPDERTIILDAQGMLVREPTAERSLPPDPRVRAANEALLHILRFDFTALEKDFELFGERTEAAWTLVLVARTDAIREGIGRITVSGEAAVVRRIELRHSAKQSIEILNAPPLPPAAFTADELKRFFR